jgi:hypothetical protein
MYSFHYTHCIRPSDVSPDTTTEKLHAILPITAMYISHYYSVMYLIFLHEIMCSK